MKMVFTIMAIICLIIISITILAGFICDTIERVYKPNIKSEEEIIGILNRTIDREFTYKVKLEFELKEVILIKDFEQELTDLVSRTLHAVSHDLLKELENYYTFEYISKYVAKSHQILLMQYIKEKKIKTR